MREWTETRRHAGVEFCGAVEGVGGQEAPGDQLGPGPLRPLGRWSVPVYITLENCADLHTCGVSKK